MKRKSVILQICERTWKRKTEKTLNSIQAHQEKKLSKNRTARQSQLEIPQKPGWAHLPAEKQYGRTLRSYTYASWNFSTASTCSSFKYLHVNYYSCNYSFLTVKLLATQSVKRKELFSSSHIALFVMKIHRSVQWAQGQQRQRHPDNWSSPNFCNFS